MRARLPKGKIFADVEGYLIITEVERESATLFPHISVKNPVVSDALEYQDVASDAGEGKSVGVSGEGGEGACGLDLLPLAQLVGCLAAFHAEQKTGRCAKGGGKREEAAEIGKGPADEEGEAAELPLLGVVICSEVEGLHLDVGKLQGPDDVPQKCGPFLTRLDQHHLPFGKGRLQNQARKTCAAADIEQGAGGRQRRENRPQGQGIEEMAVDNLFRRGYAHQVHLSVPLLQFLEVGGQAIERGVGRGDP